MPRVYRRTWTRAGQRVTSPWYSIAYTGPDGKTVKRRTRPPTTSAKVAREQLAAALAEAPCPSRETTVSAVLEAYAIHLQTHSASHYRRLGKYVLAAWERAYGTRPAAGLRLSDVDAFVRSLQERDLADSTIASHLVAIRAAYRRAEADGLVERGHPVSGVRVGYQAAERHVTWTDEELQAVARHLPRWGRDLLAVLRLTGLRVGDALALRWEQVGEDDLRLRQEKTGDYLDLPLSVAAAAVFKALPREPECPWVFPSETLTTSKRVENFRRLFLAACRSAGVTGKTIHDVRRTYATRLYNAGVSPAIVARLLGQRTTTMVRRYTHAEVETLRAAVERA